MDEIDKDIYKCVGCQAIFRDYDVDLQNYYKTEYRNHWPLKSQKKRTIWKSNFIDKVKNYIKGDSCLDIGCGSGILLNQLDIKEKYGCEMDPRFKSDNVIICDLFDYPEDKTFDIIFGLDILEHVLEVEDFVKKIYRICKDTLIINLPIDRRIHHEEPFDGHFWYFQPKSIEELFKGQFKLVKYFHLGKKIVSNGPSLICVLVKI
jgi:ubiquinone/menaquinone biosynthesis C-methylase UbiE